MAEKLKIIYYLLFVFVLGLIFKNWFINPEIIGGDWPYYQAEALKDYSLVPHLWAPWLGNGAGGINPLLGLYFFQSFLIVVFTELLQIPWTWVYKIGWFGLHIAVSVFSTIYLLKTVFRKDCLKTVNILIGSLVYVSNTYALMLSSGGQMGVALAYALSPLVLSRFIILIDNLVSKKELLKPALAAGVVLGLQIMIDARIAYVVLIAVFIYFLMNIKNKTVFASGIISMSFSGLAALLLNAFWLIPLIYLRTNPLESLGKIYTSVGALNFFSFADFSHSLSLLQPNWPENIFGKTYFLQPEFLLIPLAAFSSLLYIKKSGQAAEQAIKILFFALLGLTGIFLSKGVQDPFGFVYVWLFEHLPGFIMFRDPSKFYLLTALSYSLLIPYFLERNKFIGKKIIPILFIAVWIFTIRQAVIGRLNGTFSRRDVLPEYVMLKNLFVSQPEYYRELWVPRFERLGFASNDRMGVEAEPLLEATSAALLDLSLTNSRNIELLERRSIKYIVLPTDPYADIFISDRKYDDSLRNSYKSVLDNLTWLKKKQSLGKIVLYETPSHRDHFWLEPIGTVSYQRLDQSTYRVMINADKPSLLIFSENYHPGWQAVSGNTIIQSQKTSDSLNSFALNKQGDYSLIIRFDPQKYVTVGIFISVITLTVMLMVMITRKFF